MSLLSRPRHQLSVTAKTSALDRYGAYRYVDAPAELVSGDLQPLSADENQATDSTVATTRFRFFCQHWPGGVHTTATVTDHPTLKGRILDQIGEAEHHVQGRHTSHIEVVLQAREAKVA